MRGAAPADAEYDGAAEHMREVWIAIRSALRDVLESRTLAVALTVESDSPVAGLLARPGAWERR